METEKRGMTLGLGRLYFPELALRRLLNRQHLVCDMGSPSIPKWGATRRGNILCGHMVPLGETEGC